MGLFLRIFIRIFFFRIVRISIRGFFLNFLLCGFDARIHFFKKEKACHCKNRRQKHHINPDSDQTSNVKKSRKHAHCRVYFSDNSYNSNESKSEQSGRCPAKNIRINIFIKFIFYNFNNFRLKKCACKSENEQSKNPKSVRTLCERSGHK